MTERAKKPTSADGELVEIRISGPRKNAMSTAVMRGLLEALEAAGDRPVLLTGEGDSFSAGLDLLEIVELDDEGMARFLEVFEELVHALYFYPGPTVAYVNGHAIAGGCIMALCCDWRAARADPKVRIGLNETQLGVRFPPRTQELIERRVPRRALSEVILGAALYDPIEAARVGLVDVADEHAEALARKWIGRVATYSPIAYAGTKGDFRPPLRASAEEQERFVETSLPFWTSPELKARLRAFLKK